jgi:adenylosuccinate synthase
VPQGFSLSINASPFYPHTTSRDCGVLQGLSDAGIHPSYLGAVLMVARTFPIRVGAIVADGETLGTSGGVYSDQHEITFADIGQPEERTTVTGRVRRIFTFSREQIRDSMAVNRPSHVCLTFCNYVRRDDALMIAAAIRDVALELNMKRPTMLYEWGPSVREMGTTLPMSREVFAK